MTQFTRREFAGLAATAVAAPFAFAPTRVDAAAMLTAQQLFDAIKAQIGVAWKDETVDGLKAGDPATVVRGIMTTALPTLSVLQQAVKAGANVVIASQPAFYAKADSRTPPVPRPPGPPGAAPPPTPPPAGPPDPVFTAKNAFIDEHKLVLIRLSDHWRARAADPMAATFAELLGWTKHQVAGNPRRYDIPATTVEALVTALGKSLKVNGGLRIVGDPTMSVAKIGLLPGSTPIQAALEMLPGVDVIVGGEVREWETVEYVRDQVASGATKALILVGRITSEEPGMVACAAWLKTVAPGLPIGHIAAGDPYWRPGR